MNKGVNNFTSCGCSFFIWGYGRRCKDYIRSIISKIPSCSNTVYFLKNITLEMSFHWKNLSGLLLFCPLTATSLMVQKRYNVPL